MDSIEVSEALTIFNSRELNTKTNNYIFTDLTKKKKQELIAGIKREVIVPISLSSIISDMALLEKGFLVMNNIIIDLQKVSIKDILSYVLEVQGINSTLDFTSKLDLLRFRGILRSHNKSSSLILYNGEGILNADRKLLNEIYGFNTPFFNINDLLERTNLGTYETHSGRMLDSREDYTRIRIR